MKQVSRLKITPRIQHRKTTVRCPGCDETQNIRRSHRRNIAERLLSLLVVTRTGATRAGSDSGILTRLFALKSVNDRRYSCSQTVTNPVAKLSRRKRQGEQYPRMFGQPFFDPA